MSILLLILGLFLFVGLVVVHEFGHFIAARRGGVEVEEFGIGFPPKAWGKTLKSGLLFTINWLPLGGFVRMKGENDSAKAKGSFGAARLKTKIKILLAGVGMNLLAAFLILTFLALVGLPKIIDNQYTVQRDTKVIKSQVLVGSVESDSPASRAGLKSADAIVSFKSDKKQKTLDGLESLPQLTKEFAGQKVTITYQRSGETQTADTTLRGAKEVEASKKTSQPKGYLGVSPTELTMRRSTWSAPIVAVGVIKQFTVATFQGLGGVVWDLFHGKGAAASQQVSGPIGIFVLLKDGSLMGYQFMLIIIAIISLTLAIMNVLPIPALDGGRLFVTLLYRVVLRKPLSKDQEEKIHGTGFLVLMALILLISVIDVQRYIFHHGA